MEINDLFIIFLVNNQRDSFHEIDDVIVCKIIEKNRHKKIVKFIKRFTNYWLQWNTWLSLCLLEVAQFSASSLICKKNWIYFMIDQQKNNIFHMKHPARI